MWELICYDYWISLVIIEWCLVDNCVVVFCVVYVCCFDDYLILVVDYVGKVFFDWLGRCEDFVGKNLD